MNRKYLDIYKVKEGDTLESIAINELGNKRHALEIAIINGIKESIPIKKELMLKIVKEGVYRTSKVKNFHSKSDS